jgi:hypothetical protein
MLPLIGCARPGDAVTQGHFAVDTSRGTVLVTADGDAVGFTNVDLTRLIRTALAQTYPITCDIKGHTNTTSRRLVWHVVSSGRHPTAIIVAEIFQDSKLLQKESEQIAAPGSEPNAVTIYETSQFSQRILPPVSRKIALSKIECF